MRLQTDPLRQVHRLLAALGCAALLGGAARNGNGADTAGTAPDPVAKPAPSPNIASIEGGIEAAIDAPWRIEPDPSSAQRYPTIPIILSIHDAHMRGNDNNPALGPFCELVIREEPQSGPALPLAYRAASSIDEIERSDVWRLTLPAENHRLCRPARGEQCPADVVIGTSAEWHATFLYTPRTQLPGADVRLTIQARVAREGQACGSPLPIIDTATFDRLAPPPPPYPATGDYIMTNRLLVHLGEEPLPRFGTSYVYGDLHYHSQGTDNEGESAYAYRPTLQAMRALGLDFLFATDHASGSDDGQITDVDIIHVAHVDIPGWVPYDEDIQDFIRKIPLHEEVSSDAARDMNVTRFAALRKLLNDPPGTSTAVPTGANAEVMTFPGRKRAPRIFLGAEVDVVPEMSAGEAATGQIIYGNGRKYPWRSGCGLAQNLMDFLNGILEIRLETEVCTNTDELAVPANGRYLVRDLQGLSDSFFARQHLVHLPTDGTRSDAFIASKTSFYGGATRLLGPATAPPGDEDLVDSILYRELEVGNKGYAFLAHPVEAESGNSFTRLGPDIIPYSELQLRDAFQSPWILGLQLWNEDTRLRSATEPHPSTPGFPLQPFDNGPSFTRWHWGRWEGTAPSGAYRDLHDGIAAWEKMLLWGMRPSQTLGLRDTDGTPLLPGEPRRVFMAGGSDAHGDWNYRRQGRLFGVSAIVDSAIGKPRNFVHVGLERPETVTDQDGIEYGAVGQAQVTSALATGNFSVTDGPVLRIAIDRNNDGIIGPTDVPMGSFASVPSRGTYLPVIVEWKSTEEFGPLASIDLYVGSAVTSTVLDAGIVYASANHGVRSNQTRSGAVAPDPYVDSQGGLHWELKDGYMLDPTAGVNTPGLLRIVPSATEAKVGKRTVLLRANDFPVGRRRFVDNPDPECTMYPQICNKPGHENDEGCELICTEPPPDEYRFERVSVPDRIFVRALARTAPKGGALCVNTTAEQSEQERTAQRTGKCTERLAFTNPIWVDNTTVPPPPPPPADFSVACAPSTLTVAQGSSGTSTCTVTSINGFSKPVSLTCRLLPPGATCSFSPATVVSKANGSASTTLTVPVSMTPVGTYSFRVRAAATSVHTRETGITLTVTSERDVTAVFDATRHAPSCGDGVVGRSCDTGPLLVLGRSTGGQEPNTPNTIGDSCVDGASGPISGRWSGIDRIKVSTTDGTNLAPGKTVRIEASVWLSSVPTLDVADFFYAADATNPTWTKIASVAPASAPALSATYVLPPGPLQAVRVQYRTKGTDAPCSTVTNADRDDLIFAVAGTH